MVRAPVLLKLMTEQYPLGEFRDTPTAKVLCVFFKTKSEIAQLIRTAREKAGLSQRELAHKAGTTQAVVSRIESGNDSRMPSLTLIYRLLSAADAKLELKCIFDNAA